jgi:hypothetical protein
MTPETNEEEVSTARRRGPAVGVAVALAALAAVATGIAVQQILERRLSRPEVARLKFLRYLREHGRLES